MADLNVFGVAQPSLQGIATILTLLSCHPSSTAPRTASWFSAREEPLIYINRKPFVLRDAANPTANIKSYTGISSHRLEQAEARLKIDILKEEQRYHGLILVHEESQDGSVYPSWLAIEHLQTPKELFQSLASESNFLVNYTRIPISPEQAPEDKYIDEYVHAIRSTNLSDPLVFVCGMGLGRTTFAMVIAILLRRSQSILQLNLDPLIPSHMHPSNTNNIRASTNIDSARGSSSDNRNSTHLKQSSDLISTFIKQNGVVSSNTAKEQQISSSGKESVNNPSKSLNQINISESNLSDNRIFDSRNSIASSHTNMKSSHALSDTNFQSTSHISIPDSMEPTHPHFHDPNHNSIIQLFRVLDKALTGTSVTPIQYISTRSHSIDDLITSLYGNFLCIQNLITVLHDGVVSKRCLDEAINRCDVLVNLRTSIVEHRVRYDVVGSSADLDRSFGCLERYFFLLALSSYLNEMLSEIRKEGGEGGVWGDVTFTEWVKDRLEIWNMLGNLRRDGGSVVPFRPIDDLSGGDRFGAAGFNAMNSGSGVHGMGNSTSDFGTNMVSVSASPFQSIISMASQNMSFASISSPVQTHHAVVAGSGVAGWGPVLRNTGITDMDKHVIRMRRGVVLAPHTILKEDVWTKHDTESSPVTEPDIDNPDSTVVYETGDVIRVKGAVNFRRIPGYPLYIVAQPTIHGIRNVVRVITETGRPISLDHDTEWTILWINLREEPCVYVNGVPYVLRDQYVTLRNTKSYAGITGDRLEAIERRLRDDVSDEVRRYRGKVMVHVEVDAGDGQGGVKGVWEECGVGVCVVAPSDVMKGVKDDDDGAQEQLHAHHHGSNHDHAHHHGNGGHVHRHGHTHAPQVPSRLSHEHQTNHASKMDHVPRILYHRVPMTSESPPDPTDFDQLLRVLMSVDLKKSDVVMNCQMGLGRSTVGAVVVVLVMGWMGIGSEYGASIVLSPSSAIVPVQDQQQQPQAKMSSQSTTSMSMDDSTRPILSYRSIHSLLRVIHNSVPSKRKVDAAIDRCGRLLNLRNMIDKYRVMAELEQTDVMKRRAYIRSGVVCLLRYFMLVLFECYLGSVMKGVYDDDVRGDGRGMVSFEDWIRGRPEVMTIREELDAAYHAVSNTTGDVDDATVMAPLIPVEELAPGDGIALSTEVAKVVNRRNGAVLARGTMIKHDMFPGAQKVGLSERIEGAHNFRVVSLSEVRRSVERKKNVDEHGRNESVSGGASSAASTTGEELQFAMQITSADNDDDDIRLSRLISSGVRDGDGESVVSSLFGVGMPTKDGIRRLLSHVHAGSNGTRTVYWTSLREEPVIYINGKPYVLRLFQDPLKNLEATGISRDRVEMMEKQLRMDVVNDLRRYNGRLLLHEERMDGNGFTILPVWETVKESDVETPCDVYRCIRDEGFRVDYLRIPITDEQAPIPDVFDQLMDRVMGVGDDGDVLFNCQMGRGRTTTGMVITCLVHMVVGNSELVRDYSYLVDDDDALMVNLCVQSDGRSSEHVAQSSSQGTRTMFSHRDSEIDLHARYRAGEYKIIMQLVSVLQHGKLAKRITDMAIDMSEHMQNLRLAIYEYRLRVLNCTTGSKKHASLVNVAVNYLVRYFYLVVFADYLLEIWSGWNSVQGDAKIRASLGRSSGVDRPVLSQVSNSAVDVHDAKKSSSTASSFDANVMHEPLSALPNDGRPVRFSVWLSERKEILNILRKSNQTLD